MKYVYAHLDDEKAAKAHTRLMTQLVGAEKSTDKFQARDKRRTRSSGGKEPSSRNKASSSVQLPMAATEKASKLNLDEVPGPSGKKRAGSVRGTTARQSHGGCENSSNRQRLLEQKRGILLEMKGVVSRQAEALDRLMECSANQDRPLKIKEGGGHITSRRSSSFQESDGCSTKSSGLLPVRTNSIKKGAGARSKAMNLTTRSGSCPAALDRVLRSSRANAALPLPPFKPPENDTSAFLARGGRWGEGIRQSAPRRDSLGSPSSASYATFCNRGANGGRATLGICRRPTNVPALKV